MKKILLISALIFAFTTTQAQEHPAGIAIGTATAGSFNILIGSGAGSAITTEKYCVIVGTDSTAIHYKGGNMFWHVDYNVTISEAIKSLLLAYDRKYVGTAMDTPKRRNILINAIKNTL